MVDWIVESQLVVPDYPLERVLVGHKKKEDKQYHEIDTCLNLATMDRHKRRVKPLEQELDPPPKKVGIIVVRKEKN